MYLLKPHNLHEAMGMTKLVEDKCNVVKIRYISLPFHKYILHLLRVVIGHHRFQSKVCYQPKWWQGRRRAAVSIVMLATPRGIIVKHLNFST